MLSLGAIDHAIADFLEFKLGISTGLLLLGTSGILIYAYTVRFLAISIGSIESGYNRIHGVLDDAARNLGQNKRGILWRVHFLLLARHPLCCLISLRRCDERVTCNTST